MAAAITLAILLLHLFVYYAARLIWAKATGRDRDEA